MKLIYTTADGYTAAKSRDCYFWNIIGSTFSSLISIVFSVIVARLCVPEISDIYSVAYALASQMWTVCNFESGTLQVTDTNNKYAPSDYFSFKVIMLAVSVGATVWIVLRNLVLQHYDFYKASIVFTFCLYRIFEAFSNYYYSVFQKHEHLDIGGYSTFIRTSSSMIVFFGALLLTGNLLLAIVSICLSSLLWILLFDARLSKVFCQSKFSFQIKKISGIILECLPLFLSSFLITYIINLPKFTIDQVILESDGIQTAFNAIFQPAAVINLFCLFIFRPTLTKLAAHFNRGEYRQYIMASLKIAFFALCFSAFAMVALWFLGIPVLKLIYGETYIHDDHLLPLQLIVIGGSFYAFSQLIYNMITVIRCQYFMLAGYVIVIPAMYAVSQPLVGQYGILGAAGLYMLSMLLLFIVLLIIFIVCFKVVRKRAGVISDQ